MADNDETPKIHIDSDWKAEAQAEKERLATDSESEESKSEGLPEANFQTLVSTMATQALFAMGAIPDPRTGQRMVHLDLARHHVDMIGVLEEKSAGNLSEDEQKLVSTTLHELRSTYIQVANAARKGQAANI